MRDLVGETLSGRYRLIARIAGGGMGEVYRAHDLLLDRSVAVKILQSSLASDPDLVTRFRAEARAAARLTHSNVVGVYDWGSEDEHTYYMVMEYVSGTDLRDVLVGRGSLAPAQAAGIVASVCDALAAAHAGGLVHRDVKPENVLIARSGTVKVADFGIAVVADADRTAPGGAISGTLRYLSPEQAGGGEASAASDIWAAGALLAELLTGKPPLQGAGVDLLRRRATEAPIPPSAHARIPRVLDAIVVKACALQPGDRYDGAEEMAGALNRALSDDLPAAEPLDSLLEEVTGEVRLPDLEPTAHAFRSKRTKRRRKLIPWKSVAFVLLLALLSVGGTRAVIAFFAPAEVEVPPVVGMSQTSARDRLSDAGLELDVTGRRRYWNAPSGEVLAQSPARGMLIEGSAIEVVVSAGLPLSPVPDIRGSDQRLATVRLRTRQLHVGAVRQRFSLDAVGTVIAQQPRKGKVEWGSTVDFVVSKGPRSLDVPDVVGMTIEKATRILKQAGFKVLVVDVFSDDIAAGKVVSSTPSANHQAPEGSDVQVMLSKGPKYKKFKLPDVRNMSLAAARAKLENLGLRVVVREVCKGGKIVADTDPLPGTTVRENDRVALFVVCS